MEWFYVLLVMCILLLLCVLLRQSREPIRENTGTFNLGDLNSLIYSNKATQCWNTPNSQGCTVPHQIFW